MKKLYDKNEIWFAVSWIIIYCVLSSIGDNLSSDIGILKIITLPILIFLSLILYLFLKKNDLIKKYGLCKPKVSNVRMFYYIPLMILITVNLWRGFIINYSLLETILYILSMLLVGFLEEMIFRGLLFNAMVKDGLTSAIVVSSLTFAIGHIVNLFNGAELLPSILQVCYAFAIGYLFVIIYYKTKSLLPCILTHGVFNALSVFANDVANTFQRRAISALFLVVVSGAYALYITFRIKQSKVSQANTLDNYELIH